MSSDAARQPARTQSRITRLGRRARDGEAGFVDYAIDYNTNWRKRVRGGSEGAVRGEGRWSRGRAWPRTVPAPRGKRDLRRLALLLWFFVGASRSLRRVWYKSHVVPGKVLGPENWLFWPGRVWLGWQSEAARFSAAQYLSSVQVDHRTAIPEQSQDNTAMSRAAGHVEGMCELDGDTRGMAAVRSGVSSWQCLTPERRGSTIE